MTTRKLTGFALLTPERRREISKMHAFKAGEERAAEAGCKGGKTTGPSKAREMKGRTRVKPKATCGVRERADW